MKHVKTFEGFLHAHEIESTLYEASHSGRAWSGKIGNIDKLMSWMYDRDILNKGEKAEKNSIFREYYRFYNDGDRPRGLKYSSEEEAAAYVERRVEEFIKKVLAKYTGKFDRRDFRIDTLLGDLNTLRSITGGVSNSEPDPHGLLTYWGKNINTGNSQFEKMLGELRPLYDEAKKAANDIVDKEVADGVYKGVIAWNVPGNNWSISYQRETLQKANLWTPAAEKKYMKMRDHMMKMNDILQDVITATQKLKEEIGV